MKSRTILFVVFSLVLGGCATMSTSDKAYYQRVANSPIYCTDAEDCEVKWGRAILWVSQNSHWKIRNQSDWLITTEGPFDTVHAAYSINKVPLGNGKYQIMMQAGCGNLFGCVPSILQLKADFVLFVSQQIFERGISRTVINTAPIDRSEEKQIKPQNCIVKYDSIDIYTEPSFGSTPISEAVKGTELEAVAENNAWYKVKLEEDRFGWVAKKWVNITN
jgi:hypothetical protein